LLVAGYTTNNTNGSEAVCGVASLSVAVTVKLLAPTAVGVPEITPDEERVSPAGKPPEVIAYV
jgi:hypothetical protein